MVERRKTAPPIDDENPEWSAEDFARARPAFEVLPNLVGKEKATELFEAAYDEHARRLAKLYANLGAPKN